MKTIGHRGARGYFPENTLEGYRRTIALGVDGIELDVVCSGDRQLITSHNPFPDPDFSSVTDDLNFFDDGFCKSSKKYEFLENTVHIRIYSILTNL